MDTLPFETWLTENGVGAGRPRRGRTTRRGLDQPDTQNSGIRRPPDAAQTPHQPAQEQEEISVDRTHDPTVMPALHVPAVVPRARQATYYQHHDTYVTDTWLVVDGRRYALQ